MKNNFSREFWTVDRRNQLRELAATGAAASDIASALGVSKLSILNCCKRRGITVTARTEAEAQMATTLAREANRRKQAKWKASQKAKPATAALTVRAVPGTSKTSVIYRNQLPPLPEMTKNELRAMLAQAVRNTAGASA